MDDFCLLDHVEIDPGFRSHVLSTQLQACEAILEFARYDSLVRDVLRDCDRQMKPKIKHVFLESNSLLTSSRAALVAFSEDHFNRVANDYLAIMASDGPKSIDKENPIHHEFVATVKRYLLYASHLCILQSGRLMCLNHSDERSSFLVLRVLVRITESGGAHVLIDAIGDDLRALLKLDEHEADFVDWNSLDKCVTGAPWDWRWDPDLLSYVFAKSSPVQSY